MARIDSLTWLVGFPCLLALVTWRTVAWPYTKVEESFTIQAVHDILSYGVSPTALARYDHQVFPGAVPRSFVGPLALAATSYPFLWLCRTFGAIRTSADAQIVVRLCLGTINAFAIAFFAQSCFDAKDPRGSRSATRRTQLGFFFALTAVQFHFGFWASRTIPNSLALPLVALALALVCRNLGSSSANTRRGSTDIRTAIWLLTFSAIILRLEIAATIIPAGLYLLVNGRVSLLGALKTGLTAATFSVVLTTIVDTYFWQDLQRGPAQSMLGAFPAAITRSARGQGPPPLWPELHALVFNVVDGKSSEWGVSPWHAYFTSLLPRLLVFTSPLVALGALQTFRARSWILTVRAKFLLLTAACHMAVLSLLGHKEWRFVMYVLPALNVVGASGAEILTHSVYRKVILAVVLGLQIGLSWFSGHLSAINYPGGQALELLHEQLSLGSTLHAPVIVHIDVAPAMTGVTLFQSIHLQRNASSSLVDRFAGVLPSICEGDDCWIYDKTEDLPISGLQAASAWKRFSYLLSESSACRVLRTSEDSSAPPLPDEQQPFETLAAPLTSFGGLRRKAVPQILIDLKRIPKALVSAFRPSGSGSDPKLLQLLLPLQIVEHPAVWLCRRKRAWP